MRRSIAITSAILGLIWLAATGVLLFFVAQIVDLPWLLVAFVAQDGAFLLCLALFLISNTRRLYGVDPNVRNEQRAEQRQPAADPFASDTADLFRDAVLLPDGRPYGRRKDRDDPEVVKRLIGIPEPQAAPMPDWAKGMRPKGAPDEVVRPNMLDLSLDAATSGLDIPALDLADTSEGT